jgi:hypothetical protein
MSSRRPLGLTLLLAACMLLAALASSAAARSRHHHGRRVGGHVRQAWPQRGRAPRAPLARWLARHVGPARRKPTARTAKSDAKGSLELVRSYGIPTDDPSFARLLNWSWTYDSAVSAAAFAATGDEDQSSRLLQQLQALQHVDGSIEVAFNVATGASSAMFRSGTEGWVGLAAVTYDEAFGNHRFFATARSAADYLLTLQRPDGLIRGGPDVSWVSTQHNLLAYDLLVRLADEWSAQGNAAPAAAYRASAAAIAAGLESRLLVQNGSDVHFMQGLGDTVQPLDVQALGATYLASRGKLDLAKAVLAGAKTRFALAGRSIATSSAADTYNRTYSAAGPFSGFKPYVGTGMPDVLVFDGTAQVRLATAALAQDTRSLDDALARWEAVTRGDAPLQADRTVVNSALEIEYHVWPAASAAAWTLLAHGAPTFFAAP